MTRQEPTSYLADTYGITGEHLFTRYPNFQVFRHERNVVWRWLQLFLQICSSFMVLH